MKKQPPTRDWVRLLQLIPIGKLELADKLGVTRQSLHILITLGHVRAPMHLLGKLADVAKRTGMADGSEPPTRDELVRSWGTAADAAIGRAADALEGGT